MSGISSISLGVKSGWKKLFFSDILFSLDKNSVTLKVNEIFLNTQNITDRMSTSQLCERNFPNKLNKCIHFKSQSWNKVSITEILGDFFVSIIDHWLQQIVDLDFAGYWLQC